MEQNEQDAHVCCLVPKAVVEAMPHAYKQIFWSNSPFLFWPCDLNPNLDYINLNISISIDITITIWSAFEHYHYHSFLQGKFMQVLLPLAEPALLLMLMTMFPVHQMLVQHHVIRAHAWRHENLSLSLKKRVQLSAYEVPMMAVLSNMRRRMVKVGDGMIVSTHS